MSSFYCIISNNATISTMGKEIRGAHNLAMW